jgi:hypothetical protein
LGCFGEAVTSYEEAVKFKPDYHCLEEFSKSEIYAQEYLKQPETGLTAVQNLSGTIQGIIQLEQTKSDRILDQTIALVGVGLAISGLTATVVTQYLPKPKHEYSSGYDFTVLLSPAFIVSFLVSLPFLLILIYRFFRR